MADESRRGLRAAQVGLLVNALLAAAKLVAGIVGNAYVLVADAVESSADIVASLVVLGGISIAAQPADEDHPYGHGKAESLATAAVALMLLGAAAGIAVQAVQEIRTPHSPPAPWTLAVLVGVILVKGMLARRVGEVGSSTGSAVVRADASHHLSDAVTSAAAFVGIVVALLGERLAGGSGWAAADDWAALVAAGVIAYNGIELLRPALNDLMDRMPGDEVVEPVRRAAEGVPGVLAIEKLAVRPAGTVYMVDIHVQAAPKLPLDEAHVISGCVKSAIREAVPRVAGVLVHMEPFEGELPAVGSAP